MVKNEENPDDKTIEQQRRNHHNALADELQGDCRIAGISMNHETARLLLGTVVDLMRDKISLGRRLEH